MRVISCLLIAPLLVLASCGEEPEPVTDPAELDRLGRYGSEETEEPAESTDGEEATPEADEVPTVEGDQRAPEVFTARLSTDEGPIDIEVHRDWAPHGADRFYTLVREGFFEDVAFFRVMDGFMAQAGIHGDPAVNARWRNRTIPDDPPVESNTRGMVSFAMAGPNSRTTQFFISYGDNSNLDEMGFAPFGRVQDMSAVDSIHAGYGESAPRGQGPTQGRLQREGNAYLEAEFPELTYIRSATIVEDDEAAPAE
ncbi:MAG TPA: peptidylprolyl isomerase [Sandaracinaceae bacterium LLY-WYZ-13_1]|nr:peptidylprolyl isomerase [Sandaracinaceae bacterium LLY-WYZ-13_1]